MELEQSPAITGRNWLAIAYSGLLTGALAIVASVSLAAMIFTGDLSSHLAYGINIALVTAVVTGLILPLASNTEPCISIPQDRIAPILAIMAASMAAAPATMSSDEVFVSFVVAITATTLITGAFLFVLGLTRAGGLIRFLPYSVLGGIFAGAGWLLVLGGLRVMTGLGLDAADSLVELATPDRLARWLPGLAIALTIFLASRFVSSTKALPLVLTAATGLFFVVMLNRAETLETIGQSGWLLGPLENGKFVLFDGRFLELLTRANWPLVADQWASIGSVIVITSISIILTVSALEMLSGKDVDVNHELRMTGLANLAAGLGGGMVGFHSLSLSSLALKLGVRHRVAGIIAALTAGAVLFVGIDGIGLLPRVVVGGTLLFLGFSFLWKWLVESWKTLPRGEYLVIPLILVVIASTGFIEGLVAGLLAALFQFVLNYSRTPVIRYALSGEHARSTVERGIGDERCLVELGDRLYVLKLRGYLFFGTTFQLSMRLRARAEEGGKEALKFVILDFEQVNGIDSSAAYEFNRMRLLAHNKQFLLIFTGLNPELHEQLHASQILQRDQNITEFSDLDHSLEWCENRLLEQFGHCSDRVSRSALQYLAGLFDSENKSAQFRSYLTEVSLTQGEELIRQGEASRDLFFLEEGDVSVYLQSSTGDLVRIRRTGSGTVLGELGFYLDTPRTASVIADGPGRAYCLSTEALRDMETRHPELATALHRFIADLLAERQLRTTQTLEAVLG